MFYLLKKKKIYPADVSKHDSNREKQVIILMIPNGEGWHYLAVKKLSAWLRGITSKNNSDLYCLNCLHYFRTKNKLESYKRVCKNKGFCNVIITSKGTKTLGFNQYQKSDKAPFILYADLECLIKKIDGCKNNAENLSTTKVSEHIPSGFSMSTISSFRSIENKHDVYKVKIVWKSFLEFLREHAIKIINFKKKKVQLLTNEQQQSYEKAKICYICKEKFENKYLKDKKCLSVFHNGSNYDYHFIIKELAEEFKKQFTCLRENTEKTYNWHSSNMKRSYKKW